MPLRYEHFCHVEPACNKDSEHDHYKCEEEPVFSYKFSESQFLYMMVRLGRCTRRCLGCMRNFSEVYDTLTDRLHYGLHDGYVRLRCWRRCVAVSQAFALKRERATNVTANEPCEKHYKYEEKA